MLDSNNNKLGDSKVAARTGIAAVVLSRIAMSSPSMGQCSIVDFVLVWGWEATTAQGS